MDHCSSPPPVKDQPTRKRPRPEQQAREAAALAAKRAENLRQNLMKRKDQARAKQDDNVKD